MTVVQSLSDCRGVSQITDTPVLRDLAEDVMPNEAVTQPLDLGQLRFTGHWIVYAPVNAWHDYAPCESY
jgi:hypothetical protein